MSRRLHRCGMSRSAHSLLGAGFSLAPPGVEVRTALFNRMLGGGVGMGAAVLLSQRRAAEAAPRVVNSRLELRVAEQTQSVTAANNRLTQQLAEQQQIEAALRESRQRCELAAEGADGGVWEWDLETRSPDYSPRWNGQLGCRESGIEPTMAAWES